MNKHSFSIIIEHDVDGYAAFCPELQGCYSQGDTYEEAMLNIKDAIKLNFNDEEFIRKQKSSLSL